MPDVHIADELDREYLEPATPAPATNQSTMSDLISGILSDAKVLFRQQIDLFRAELQQDVSRTKTAVKYFSGGFIALAVGAIFLLIGSVFLLEALFPNLPRWGAWAIVGGGLFLGGMISLFVAKRIFDHTNPLPDKSFNVLEENLSWLMNPRK
jgi:hypothetical protein